MKKRKTNSTYADQDYWNKLGNEEKEFLRSFNKTYYYGKSDEAKADSKDYKRNNDINKDLFSVFKNVRSINENFDESQIQEAMFVASDELEEESEVIDFWNGLTQRQQKQFVKILGLRTRKIMKNLGK